MYSRVQKLPRVRGGSYTAQFTSATHVNHSHPSSPIWSLFFCRSAPLQFKLVAFKSPIVLYCIVLYCIVLYCIVLHLSISIALPSSHSRSAPDHSNWCCVGVYTPQRYKNLPKVPSCMWRLERDSNTRPSAWKASSLAMPFQFTYHSSSLIHTHHLLCLWT